MSFWSAHLLEKKHQTKAGVVLSSEGTEGFTIKFSDISHVLDTASTEWIESRFITKNGFNTFPVKRFQAPYISKSENQVPRKIWMSSFV